MKLEMNERVKHRMTGIIVILSIAIIFLPALMKKSNQRFVQNVRVAVQIPPKPLAPNITIPNKRDLFHNVKIAHVTLPPEEKKPTFALAAAESLRAQPPQIPPNSNAKPMTTQSMIHLPLFKESFSKNDPITTPINSRVPTPQTNKKHDTIVKSQPLKSVFTNKVNPPSIIPSQQKVAKSTPTPLKWRPQASNFIQRKPTLQSRPPYTAVKPQPNQYSVQVASLTRLENAMALVSRLRQHGYTVTAQKVLGPANQVYYKVVVGRLTQRESALLLQKQIANNFKINGFIVRVG